jgi:hypothetical protein
VHQDARWNLLLLETLQELSGYASAFSFVVLEPLLSQFAMKDVCQKGRGKVQEENVLLACEFILEVKLVS